MGYKKKKSKNIPLMNNYDVKEESQKNMLGKKIKEERLKMGLSLSSLAEALKVCNIHVYATTICKWEQGESAPTPYQLFALCRFFNIEDGIRYFSGPLRANETSLNEEGLKKLEGYRDDLIASGKYNLVDPEEDTEGNQEFDEYKVYYSCVSAGTGNFLEGDDYRMVTYPKKAVPDKADFAVTVDGDSMTPKYTDGQLVWVQETPQLYNGEIGIFILNECGYIKKYCETVPDEEELEDYQTFYGEMLPKIELISLNEKYKPIVIGEYDDLRIVGRVLTK